MPRIKMLKVNIGLNVEDLHIGKKVYGKGYLGWSTGYTGRYGRTFINIHVQFEKRRVKFLTPKARHIYQMSIGEKVPRSLHVDHIDNDCSNDELSNLQLLTPEENLNKLYEDLKENYGEAWAAQCVAKIRRKKRRAE